jgi:hypothetical protein
MNSYHYLFKFIVIGDTGKIIYLSLIGKVLVNHALYYNLFKAKLEQLMM